MRQVLNVARPHEDEVARNAVHTNARARALRVSATDRESLLLHGGEDVPLQMAQLGQLIDEQHALVGLVDCPRDHALHPAGPLVNDTLPLAELTARRRDPTPAWELTERDLKDPAKEIPERVLGGAALERGLRTGALGTHSPPP